MDRVHCSAQQPQQASAEPTFQEDEPRWPDQDAAFHGSLHSEEKCPPVEPSCSFKAVEVTTRPHSRIQTCHTSNSFSTTHTHTPLSTGEKPVPELWPIPQQGEAQRGDGGRRPHQHTCIAPAAQAGREAACKL
eukprot:scaffold204365_cov14-Tisochrysis_lutea.AAC.1